MKTALDGWMQIVNEHERRVSASDQGAGSEGRKVQGAMWEGKGRKSFCMKASSKEGKGS